jgi:hypothetical protein
VSREQCPEDITYQDIVTAIKVLRCYIERVEEVRRLLRRAGIADLLTSRGYSDTDFIKWLFSLSAQQVTQQQQQEIPSSFTEEEKQRLRELAKKYAEQKT